MLAITFKQVETTSLTKVPPVFMEVDPLTLVSSVD